MSHEHAKREAMSIEETTVSIMWEIVAIVEVLERKGLCSKQDLYDIFTEIRCMNPRVRTPEPAFPEPYITARAAQAAPSGLRIVSDVVAKATP